MPTRPLPAYVDDWQAGWSWAPSIGREARSARPVRTPARTLPTIGCSLATSGQKRPISSIERGSSCAWHTGTYGAVPVAPHFAGRGAMADTRRVLVDPVAPGATGSTSTRDQGPISALPVPHIAGYGTPRCPSSDGPGGSDRERGARCATCRDSNANFADDRVLNPITLSKSHPGRVFSLERAFAGASHALPGASCRRT